MERKKFKIIIRLLLLLVVINFISIQIAVLILNSPSTPRDFTSDGHYYIVGNERYATNQSMTINRTIISPTYVQFNTTGFNVTSANTINISLVFINSSIVDAEKGDKVLEFWANTSSGNVWFNLSGFESGTNYTVNKSAVTIATPVANATGIIHFNNSVWSEQLFEIYRTGISWQIINNTINGGYTNTTLWHTVNNTINGAYTNTTTWKNVNDTINGTYTNTTHWLTVDSSINGIYTNNSFLVCGNFTVHVAGCIVTVTPDLCSGVTLYRWIVENDINSTSEWIPAEDEIDHMFVLNYGESYLITLEVQNTNTSESSTTSRRVEIGSRYVTYPRVVEPEVEEEPSKYKTFYDDFPQEVKDWFAQRNSLELIIVSLVAIFLVVFFDRKYRKKKK